MPRARSETELARGFAPVVGRAPRVLLLGSLPGAASIAAGEYYAMRHNAFWQIMGALCGAGPELAYGERLAVLKRHGIALWDVLHAAVRPGSLDADIVAATQQINDIAGLLVRQRTIGLIACNGQKAAALFRRHVAPRITATDVRCVTLPSTSPAYASLRPAQKLVHWRAALAPHLQIR